MDAKSETKPSLDLQEVKAVIKSVDSESLCDSSVAPSVDGKADDFSVI